MRNGGRQHWCSSKPSVYRVPPKEIQCSSTTLEGDQSKAENGSHSRVGLFSLMDGQSQVTRGSWSQYGRVGIRMVQSQQGILRTIIGETTDCDGLTYTKHVVTQSLRVYLIWGFILARGLALSSMSQCGSFWIHHRTFILVRQRGQPIVFNTDPPGDVRFFIEGIQDPYKSTYATLVGRSERDCVLKEVPVSTSWPQGSIA